MNRLRAWFASVIVLLFAAAAALAANAELRFCLRAEPKTFNPLQVDDEASVTIRYLTGGVLMRVNRHTQALEPGLATAWKVSPDGKSITLTLRDHVFFSDGTPFGPEDVAFTVERMMDPALHSPTGDSFRSGQGKVTTTIKKNQITVSFPAPVAGLDRQFDQVAIMSSRSPKKEMAVLGPYYVAEYKSGSYVLLKRNGNYWKRDAAGRQLPYIETIRLDIQNNRDIEALRFKRGELQLIDSIDSEYYDKLASGMPNAVHDAGPSLDPDFMWFNQVPNAAIPAYKLAWFQSVDFRRAVSLSINRNDMVRVVFGGHARPAVGPTSSANLVWFNSKLRPEPYDVSTATRLLTQSGFKLSSGVLRDKDGHAVEFSIITNAGAKFRERMATMIQQDLSKIGIKVNVVTLDFPSLIERMADKFNYEAILLGITNVEPDPNAQMSMWLSSGDNHQWNPRQKSPATRWEAEIDRLMRAQASGVTVKQRKPSWDRVQEIIAEQLPLIYLVNRNALSAISPAVRGATPANLKPQTFWNIETWQYDGGGQ